MSSHSEADTVTGFDPEMSMSEMLDLIEEFFDKEFPSFSDPDPFRKDSQPTDAPLISWAPSADIPFLTSDNSTMTMSPTPPFDQDITYSDDGRTYPDHYRSYAADHIEYTAHNSRYVAPDSTYDEDFEILGTSAIPDCPPRPPRPPRSPPRVHSPEPTGSVREPLATFPETWELESRWKEYAFPTVPANKKLPEGYKKIHVPHGGCTGPTPIEPPRGRERKRTRKFHYCHRDPNTAWYLRP